jgi:hypothetical protein
VSKTDQPNVVTEYQGPPPPTEETTAVPTTDVHTTGEDGSWVDSIVRYFTRTPATYTFGKPTTGSFSEVDGTQEVKVGDTVRLTYDLRLPILLDWQKDYIVSHVQADPRFDVRYVAYSADEGKVWIEVRVLQAMSPVALIAIAVIGLLAVAGIWLVTSKMEKLSTLTVPGLGPVNTFPILVVGGLALGFLAWWSWGRRHAAA